MNILQIHSSIRSGSSHSSRLAQDIVERLRAKHSGATVTVEGLLRFSEPKGGFMRDNVPAEDRWHSRDVQAIAQAKGLQQAAPFFVDQGLPGAAVAATWPRPGLTVIQFTNTHAVYALTWYGLALMVVGAAWLVVRHERRKRSS